ncbi:MAG: hypothetical protein JWM99_4541, partial [Verrucomicrobiales bacterium]|nr:hypothetical protein [Verrucomicrobiales bacterium]
FEKILYFKVGEPVYEEKIQQLVLKIQKMYVDAGHGAILVRAGVLTDKKLGESSVTFQIGEDPVK